MDFLKKNYMGIFVCFVIAVPSWLLGKRFPVVGGAVIAIILGMIIALFWNDKGKGIFRSFFRPENSHFL